MTEQEIKKIDEWIDSIITTQKTMPGVDGYILDFCQLDLTD